ncbi:hypothetical protein [Bradyrhizobium erythrophlei]|uniref:hypothetical protein n=1 Tax=Bradyrhizobium erythrophlei TaxID=1437360 RepID=UPI0012EB482F|nr:hypothetical protein [Bradyrhizobium erythrophlei]
MKLLPVADAPKFVKDIEPGVMFCLTHKTEKCFGWKCIEVGTNYAYLVFSTPFRNVQAFELVDAEPLADEIGIPFTDAKLLPNSATMESARTPEAKAGTLLVSPNDAGLVVTKQHQSFILSLDSGQLSPANAAAWVSYPAWEIVSPVDPKNVEKGTSILTFSAHPA